MLIKPTPTLKVFIGFDPRQPIAYHVLAHSIISRASKPVSISPLRLAQLPIKRRGLTDFTYSRFLVPYLSQYKGQSIFIDSDFLCLGDIWELAKLINSTSTVTVVNNSLKFERASMMVFNNQLCEFRLTPKIVDDPANTLYDFAWAVEVGHVAKEWNHLVGYDPPNPNAKLIHFTQGIPCFPETKECEFAAEWMSEAQEMVSTVSWAEIMGRSVHAQPVLNRLSHASS